MEVVRSTGEPTIAICADARSSSPCELANASWCQLTSRAFILGGFAVWSVTTTDMTPEFADLWPMIQNSLDLRELLGNMTFIESGSLAFRVADPRPGVQKTMFENRDFTIGDDLISQFGLKQDHPIILLPGIVSTGLESWSTEPVARPLFRSRLWGTSTMIRVSW